MENLEAASVLRGCVGLHGVRASCVTLFGRFSASEQFSHFRPLSNPIDSHAAVLAGPVHVTPVLAARALSAPWAVCSVRATLRAYTLRADSPNLRRV